MKLKLINTFLSALLIIVGLQPNLAFAEESNNVNSADVVILVDFSGSITNDPRYPAAERKALQNLVNVDWPSGSNIAIIAFGAADNRNGGKPSAAPMCPSDISPLRSVDNIENWIEACVEVIGTSPVGPNTDHNKAIKYAVELLLESPSQNSSKFVLLMTDGKLDVDNANPVNPDYTGTSDERDKQAIEELFTEVLPLARENGIQIWPVGFGDVNRIELNGYAPEGGQPGPDSCQREIPRAVIAEPEDLPYEINKIIRQVTCLGEYLQGDNVEIVLPDYAESATINVQHQEGETFKVQGPSGEEIEAGGEGTESTVEINNPTGGNWQIISDTPVQAGYWWETSFEPQVTCPTEDNVVQVSVVPANDDSTSAALSPVFNLDLIVNGEKETVQLELGETTTFQIEGDEASIFAEASVSSIDQPGILSFDSIQTECSNLINIEITSPPATEDTVEVIEVVEEEVLDCEATPELEECEEPFIIPWWLIALLIITIGYLIWLYLKSRKLKEGTFVVFDSSGEQGRVRVRKNTKSLAFAIDEQSMADSRVSKSTPEVFGSYEVSKGKRGVDFVINGPAGSGSAQERYLNVGDEVDLENGYKLTFEDGTNKKPIIVDTDNPFDDQTTGSNFENNLTIEEGDSNDPFQ